MSFFIDPVISAATGLVLVLISFILQGILRKKDRPAILVRIISGIGILGSAYFSYTVIAKLFASAAGDTGTATILTITLPLALLALLLLAHFIVLFAKAAVRGNAPLNTLNLVLFVITLLQLILRVFNLLSHWSYYSVGELTFLYIQVVQIVITLINAVLFTLIYFKGKKVASLNNEDPAAKAAAALS